MKSRVDIVYDANFSVNQYRGMGKYINNFVAVLRKRNNLIINGLLKSGTVVADSDNFYVFGFSIYVLWEQLSLYFFLRKFKGIVIFPYNTASVLLSKSISNVLIIHDVIYMNSFNTNSLKQKLGAFYRRLIVPIIIRKFQHIITVSEFSKGQLIKYFDLCPDKITVIPNSVKFDRSDTVVNPRFEDRANYLLHIGGEPDYKNSKSLLYAFSRLPGALKVIYKIKIIGIRNPKVLGEYLQIARELNIESCIEFLSYQTDEEIISLYKHAKMFIFPSFSEGFGIPIIEAFKYGCPVLCSDASCFPEVAGDAAYYFDPNEPGAIAESIQKVLGNEKLTKEKILMGYERAMLFSADVFEDKIISWYDNRF